MRPPAFRSPRSLAVEELAATGFEQGLTPPDTPATLHSRRMTHCKLLPLTGVLVFTAGGAPGADGSLAKGQISAEPAGRLGQVLFSQSTCWVSAGFEPVGSSWSWLLA